MPKRQPEPEKVPMASLNARIPIDLHRELGKAKYDRGKSIQEMVIEALEQYLSRRVETDAKQPARPRAPKG